MDRDLAPQYRAWRAVYHCLDTLLSPPDISPEEIANMSVGEVCALVSGRTSYGLVVVYPLAERLTEYGWFQSVKAAESVIRVELYRNKKFTKVISGWYRYEEGKDI